MNSRSCAYPLAPRGDVHITETRDGEEPLESHEEIGNSAEGKYHSPRARDHRADRARLLQLGDRGNPLHLPRDSQNACPTWTCKDEGADESRTRLPRNNGRVARNALTGTDEDPFPKLHPDVRRRVERYTGTTLEKSYEGLTEMLLRGLRAVWREEARADRPALPARSHRKRGFSKGR